MFPNERLPSIEPEDSSRASKRIKYQPVMSPVIQRPQNAALQQSIRTRTSRRLCPASADSFETSAEEPESTATKVSDEPSEGIKDLENGALETPIRSLDQNKGSYENALSDTDPEGNSEDQRTSTKQSDEEMDVQLESPTPSEQTHKREARNPTFARAAAHDEQSEARARGYYDIYFAEDSDCSEEELIF